MTEKFCPKALVISVLSVKIRMMLGKAIPKSIFLPFFATIFFFADG